MVGLLCGLLVYGWLARGPASVAIAIGLVAWFMAAVIHAVERRRCIKAEQRRTTAREEDQAAAKWCCDSLAERLREGRIESYGKRAVWVNRYPTDCR